VAISGTTAAMCVTRSRCTVAKMSSVCVDAASTTVPP